MSFVVDRCGLLLADMPKNSDIYNVVENCRLSSTLWVLRQI